MGDRVLIFSNTMADEEESPCPVCSKFVTTSIMTFHIESCLEEMERKDKILQLEKDEQ